MREAGNTVRHARCLKSRVLCALCNVGYIIIGGFERIVNKSEIRDSNKGEEDVIDLKFKERRCYSDTM